MICVWPKAFSHGAHSNSNQGLGPSMSSVWSGSMSNGVSDLKCHMHLSAYKLTGRHRGCVCVVPEESNWINSNGQGGRELSPAPASGFRCPLHIDTRCSKTPYWIFYCCQMLTSRVVQHHYHWATAQQTKDMMDLHISEFKCYIFLYMFNKNVSY